MEKGLDDDEKEGFNCGEGVCGGVFRKGIGTHVAVIAGRVSIGSLNVGVLRKSAIDCFLAFLNVRALRGSGFFVACTDGPACTILGV